MVKKVTYIKCNICGGTGVNHYADNAPCGVCKGDGVVPDKEPPPKKRRARPLIPSDYYMAVADSIHQMNPTREIVFNCIKEVGCDSFSRGYLRRIEDSRVFKDRQEQNFKEYWNGLKDFIDDVINNRVQPKQAK